MVCFVIINSVPFKMLCVWISFTLSSVYAQWHFIQLWEFYFNVSTNSITKPAELVQTGSDPGSSITWWLWQARKRMSRIQPQPTYDLTNQPSNKQANEQQSDKIRSYHYDQSTIVLTYRSKQTDLQAPNSLELDFVTKSDTGTCKSQTLTGSC